jgi:hypothetical protein
MKAAPLMARLGGTVPRPVRAAGSFWSVASSAHDEAVLRSADFLLVDGPKDGIFEPAFVERVLPLPTDRRRFLGFDDIRMLQMTQLWRALPYSKIDATSFGRWSGTGLMATA